MNDPRPLPLVPGSIDLSTKATVLGGGPLATVIVWWFDNLYLKPRGLPPLDNVAAVSFGVVGAALFGESWKYGVEVAEVFLTYLKEKLK